MINVNLDDQDLVIQKNGDQGDCAARTFCYLSGLKVRSFLGMSTEEWPPISYWKAKMALVTQEGIVLRYNREGRGGEKYNDPFDNEWGTSRDQTMPVVIATDFYNDPETARLIYSFISKNWFRYPNGDVLAPEAWTCFARACRWSVSEWRLSLADHCGVVGNWFRCRQALADPDDVGDDILSVQYMAQARFCGTDTAGAKANRNYYATHRPYYVFMGGDPRMPMNYSRVTGPGAQFAWRHYHRPETFNNPQDELWSPIITQMFGGLVCPA